MGSTRMYRVGLMSLLMIHEAYMPVYMGSRFSLHRTYGRAGPPEVVQEALADLKITLNNDHLLKLVILEKRSTLTNGMTSFYKITILLSDKKSGG